MEARADTLIKRFVDEPGSYEDVGDGASAFRHDQNLADDIAVLGVHAIAALISCLGDDRPTKVAVNARHYGDAQYATVGLLCQELLRETTFFKRRDTALIARAAKDARVSKEVGVDGIVYYWASSADALIRAQRVWQHYWRLYRELRLTSEPELALSAIGCYTLRLHRTKWDITEIDTTRQWHFELDTLPLPGTVRPDRIELGRGRVIGPARSRWGALGERSIAVSWHDNAAAFGFVFGGADSSMHGFQLIRFGPPEQMTFGGITVEREQCDNGAVKKL